MIAAFILLLVAVAWRVVLGWGHQADFGWLHNFTPLAAIALCGAMHLPRRLAFGVPLIALLISDVILNQHYGASLLGVEMLTRYAVLAGVAGMGWWLRKHPQAALVLGCSALGSIAFYFVTNTASWIDNPAYAKTFAGWAQALTGGVDGYPDTTVFFRNSLISDVLFTALFLAAMNVSRRSEKAPFSTTAEPARWA
jgi:hypothetical protein